jgi:hypothetical protein
MIANWFSGSKRTILVLLTALATLLLPALGWAAGGENVHLEFTDGDKMYLYASLAFGFIALITAFVLRGQVMSRSQGRKWARPSRRAPLLICGNRFPR